MKFLRKGGNGGSKGFDLLNLGSLLKWIPIDYYGFEFTAFLAMVGALCFYKRLGILWDFFISVDESFMACGRMDVARICVRVPLDFVLGDHMVVVLDGMEFILVLREDHYGDSEVRITKDRSRGRSPSNAALSLIGAIWGR